MEAATVHSPLLTISAPHGFEVAVLILGGLLVGGALWSGNSRSKRLPLPLLFVLAGFLLGDGGVGLVHFTIRSPFVSELATIALVVILFRDGLEVEGEMLQAHWHLPLRKLVLAMPITAVIVALAARALLGLSWTESFLVGALLSPTDPVLSSSVVTNPRVPRLVRHSLNLESGLNDGLALPPVLALSAALAAGAGHFVWWRFVIENLGFGVGVGVLVGVGAAALMPPGRGLEARVPAHQKSLFALGTAFVAYGIAVLLPNGNGLIAVYVGAIALTVRQPELGLYFGRQAADLVELVKVGIFAVFGSLLTLHALFHDGWAAVGVVAATFLIARPVGVFTALSGTPTDVATRGFMAWFGPKGVATITFSILVLSQGVHAGQRIFDLSALAVFASIIAHGLSDWPAAEWLARRAEAPGKQGPGGAEPARPDGAVSDADYGSARP